MTSDTPKHGDELVTISLERLDRKRELLLFAGILEEAGELRWSPDVEMDRVVLLLQFAHPPRHVGRGDPLHEPRPFLLMDRTRSRGSLQVIVHDVLQRGWLTFHVEGPPAVRHGHIDD